MAKRGVKPILSDQQLIEMAELRESGWAAPRIAKHFTAAGTPISTGAIYWQCTRIGAEPPRLQRRATPHQRAAYTRNGHVVRAYTPEEDALLRQLDLEGLSYPQIAERLGRKQNSVIGRLMTIARKEARQEEGHG